MYIAPNTNIRILTGVPLEPSYENTLYFSSISAQTNYFSSKAKYSLTQNTYQRVNRGVIRVGIKADSLYDCNYVMFQNASYGNKWFYAFIRKVEFVADTRADIYFDIDVMQTYWFDFSLKECLVERQHSTTDVPGDNLVPEGLETGEYLDTVITSLGDLSSSSIVVACACTENAQDFHGGYFNGTYSGLNYVSFDNTFEGAKSCSEFIKTVVGGGKPDSIVSVFLMPKKLVASDGQDLITGNFTVTESIPTSLDGYTPKNKKLLTSPYSFLTCTTRMGTIKKWDWEFFTGDSGVRLWYAGDTTPSPSVWAVPMDYKGLRYNYDEACIMSGFPQIAYNVDTFRAWLAQSAGTLAVNGITSGLQASSRAASSAVSAAGAAAAAGAAGSIGLGATLAIPAVGVGVLALSALTSVIEHAYLPTVARGSQSSMVWAGQKDMTFLFYHRHITAQFARIIDEYFDMYGYALHRVAIPNVQARKRWTYVKTIGCAVVGTMPADDMRKIQQIFDNGVRFWRNPSEVGNYSLDNSL